MSGCLAGRCKGMIRRHDQKDLFLFQKLIFQLGVFMNLVKNAEIKLIVKKKFFLDGIGFFQDINLYFGIFLKKEVMI